MMPAQTAADYETTANYPDINGDGKADIVDCRGAGFECGLAP
jgi:hypothetical protein